MKNVAVPAIVTRPAGPVSKLASVVAFAAVLAGVAACSVTTTDNGASTSCTTDSSLACVTGTQGYTCTGLSQPEDADPGLVCSSDNGAGSFCCATSACNYDANVSCGGATGYSCATGAAPPDSQDATLVCSTATNANGVDTYCCYTDTNTASGTCTDDPSIVGCQPNSEGTPSYGFSCTGTDTPDQDFSNITCSTPTDGTSATNYCCVYN